MLARDDSVLVDTLGGAAHHRLEVLAEVGGLEIGIQLRSQVVAKIPGVLGVVVAADAPRVLVFGKITRDELDGVERIGFTGLPSSEDSTADSLFRNLCAGEKR